MRVSKKALGAVGASLITLGFGLAAFSLVFSDHVTLPNSRGQSQPSVSIPTTPVVSMRPVLQLHIVSRPSPSRMTCTLQVVHLATLDLSVDLTGCGPTNGHTTSLRTVQQEIKEGISCATMIVVRSQDTLYLDLRSTAAEGLSRHCQQFTVIVVQPLHVAGPAL